MKAKEELGMHRDVDKSRVPLLKQIKEFVVTHVEDNIYE